MQRVNEDYAKNVTAVLDNAISSLIACADTDTGIDDENSDTLCDVTAVARDLTALRDQMGSILTLTLFQDESLRSETRKFECERSTKTDTLARLQKQHQDLSEERAERRLELENELLGLKTVFKEKQQVMTDEHVQKERLVLSEMDQQREAYEKDHQVLKERKLAVQKEYEDRAKRYASEKANITAQISSIRMDIQTLSSEHSAFSTAKQTEVDSVKAQLDREVKRRLELEERFKRVDADNAIKKQEEEHIQMVDDLERQAMALLDNGAISLQKLWRGVKERELVAKMKSKKKKKGGGKKKKKK